MGIDNIAAGHGVGIAITGMLIVLAGLVLISLFVAALPRLAGERRTASEGAATGTASGPLDPDLLAAIGYVVEAEWLREQTMDRQRITIEPAEEQRVWTAIGKMRTLSTRL